MGARLGADRPEVHRRRRVELQRVGARTAVHGGFRAVVRDGVVTTPAAHGVRATATVDRVSATAARQDVDAA